MWKYVKDKLIYIANIFDVDNKQKHSSQISFC